MNKIHKLIITISLTAALAGFSHAGVVVIVNKDNPVDALTAKEASKIFLKKKKAFSSGSPASPVDLKADGINSAFYMKVANRKETQIKSYWARMVFSGKDTPPLVAYSASEVKTIVAGSVDAIGYIDEKDVDSSVKVVLTLP